MNEFQSSISRRNLLRTCAVTGAGFITGLHRVFPMDDSRPAAAGPTKDNIIVGFDIGPSEVCVPVGELLSDETIRILGIGRAPSLGVMGHGIVDCEAVNACVRAALVDAKTQSDLMLCRLALAAPGTNAFDDSAEMWEQIFEWEETCYAADPDGSLYRATLADCKRARYMSVVCGVHERMQNSIRCLQEVVNSIDGRLRPRHRNDRGVLMIDMDEGTTDYTVSSVGELVHSDCLAVGTGRLAKDLALGLRVPLSRAKLLLTEEGAVWVRLRLLIMTGLV